jgi:hypothetical protein
LIVEIAQESERVWQNVGQGSLSYPSFAVNSYMLATLKNCVGDTFELAYPSGK